MACVRFPESFSNGLKFAVQMVNKKRHGLSVNINESYNLPLTTQQCHFYNRIRSHDNDIRYEFY